MMPYLPEVHSRRVSFTYGSAVSVVRISDFISHIYNLCHDIFEGFPAAKLQSGTYGQLW